jgi:hypothetical protein
MSLRDAKVEWMEGFDNTPGFKILVDDDWADHSEHRYEERNGIYLSILPNGMVSFFFYKSPGDGFGGRKFTLKMKDGTERELIGPWSSNSDAVNRTFPESQVNEVTYTSEDEVWEKGFTFYAGSCTVDILIEAAKICGVNLVRAKFHRGTYVVPSLSPDKVVKPRKFTTYQYENEPNRWGNEEISRDSKGNYIILEEGVKPKEYPAEIIDVLHNVGEVEI